MFALSAERRFRSLLLLFAVVVLFVVFFICSFNCILLRLAVDVFLLLFAKIDKFYTRLVTLTSSVFVFSPICGSECVLLLLLLLLVCLCGYRICFGCCLRGVLKGRGCFDEEFLSALFSLTRKRGRSLSELKRLVWDFQRRNKVVVFERGARWGRSLLAR